MATAPAHEPGSAAVLRRRRHALVVVLTFVTGSADATGFLALGGAFSSVMTGNMVLLGLSAGTASAALAINSGSAIASYIMGVLIGLVSPVSTPPATRCGHGPSPER